jgi:archaellum component FlaC
MAQGGLHQGLELRVEVLADRIARLKDKMNRAEGIQKIENLGDLERLEGRYKDLKDRLDALNREGPGFRHQVKNELEKLSADLSGTLDDFIMWMDSGYHPDKRPAPKPLK